MFDGTLKFDTAIDKTGFENGLAKLGSIAKTGMIAVTAAITAATTATAVLGKQALDAYADFEQLSGGAELMFGSAYDFVMQKAKDAYKTVQMSQNDYLQQVNGFAVGLKTALGGNEKAAAELADKIVKAEADVVAATGNTAENIQNAFNGIMKSNFTMLDNLQLGITPTKEGFQELIDKVNEWNAANGRATDYQISNLADCQQALVDYIEMQGLAGYASNEAAETISGSIAMFKGAWENVLVGIADDSQNFNELVDNLVESFIAVAGNIKPRVEVIIGGIEKLLKAAINVFPSVVGKIIEYVPRAAELGEMLLTSLVKGIIDNLPAFTEKLKYCLTESYKFVSENIKNLLPIIVDVLPDLIAETTSTLLKMITDNLPVFTETAKDFIFYIAAYLVNILHEEIPVITAALPDLIIAVIDTLIGLMPALTDGAVTLFTAIIDAIPIILEELIPRIPEIAAAVIVALLSCTQDLLDASTELFWTLVEGLAKAVGGIAWGLIDLQDDINAWWDKLFSDIKKNLANVLAKIVSFAKDLREKGRNAARELVFSIINGIASLPSKVGETGKNIVHGMWNGIMGEGGWLREKIFGFGESILESFKETFGIHSPSTVMRDSVGKYLAQGVGVGFMQEMPKVGAEIDDSALSAIQNQNLGSFARSAAVETLSSTYIYNSNQSEKTAQEIVINAKFAVGEEVVAEGVTRIVADKIDEKQGIDIELKKRGLTA